jgi:hypothetical protein
VPDAARRLVALDARHVDRANAEAALLAGKEMALVADEVARPPGRPTAGAGCWPPPGARPSGAPSTPRPTSASARCTSPS